MNTSRFDPLGPVHYSSAKSDLGSNNQPAKRVGIFFATREGHTQRVAERVAADLLFLGFDVDLLAVRRPLPFSLSNYSAAVLAAPVHAGSHEKEMVKFVKQHRRDLERIPTAFLSVTLSEAGAEMPGKTPTEHAQFVQDVARMLGKFFQETGWHPTLVKPVAGALLYRHYNFVVRLIMKSIAKKAGASTDTLRDYDYTDWIALDKFVNDLAAVIRGARDSEPAQIPNGSSNLACGFLTGA